MYTYAYDPELDLWSIIDPKGYTIDWECFKWQAVLKVKRLNNG